VTPLLKKPSLDPDVYKNYRPVSNLNFLSKVLEKVVASQINDHLAKNNIHEPFQSAYRQGHSTETALLRVHNDVIRAIGEQKVMLLVLLDLSAAFDTVNHQSLLTALQELGVSEVALQWLQSYLTCRKQVINVKGTYSKGKEVTCGVPQGSVLGPILFNIYTSSLGRLLHSAVPQYHMYADDTSFYICVKPELYTEAADQIATCVSLVNKWMGKYELKMNDEKTEFIVISSKQTANKVTPTPLMFGNIQICPLSSVRSLGVTTSMPQWRTMSTKSAERPTCS